MKVTSSHINRMLKREISTLYGPSSELFRLEWGTETGGTLNVPHNEYVGATKTVQVQLNVPGIWGPVMRDQREHIQIDGQMISIDQLGFIYFANDLNLSGKDKLVILQHVKDKYYSGDGTGSAAVWTPDTAPAWTVEEWISYWLVFADRRFKIISNTASALTVALGSSALPTSSTASEIMMLVEWQPIRRDLGVAAGAISPLGEQLIFQSVFVSRIPVVGQ